MYLFNSLCELISIIYTAYFLRDVYSSQATYFFGYLNYKGEGLFLPPSTIYQYICVCNAITRYYTR